MVDLSEPLPNSGIATDVIKRNPVIHEIFNKTKWSEVRPCAEYINEMQQFNKAKSCSNLAFVSEYNKTLPDNVSTPPRCFVLPHGSPDVFFSEENYMNFSPIRIGNMGFLSIVGLYQPETETIFLVENYDIAMVYRHELQHYFQHKLDPELLKDNHGGLVWNLCEPKYYTPSQEQINLYKQQLHLIRNQ
ncbi:hypothetical protein EBU71_04305 [bacterium]|nr:hypothetical protein [Candidatus Elulimicrobium humile]